MYLAYSFSASFVNPFLSTFLPASLRSYHRKLTETNSEAQINPSIIVIIVILTIIFFLSACMHLLIRCIARNPRRDANATVTLTALQGQLQQLFHLHDSGVEQALIDKLPVFPFRGVTGLKGGADCAICLCEFRGSDRLRLLPSCSHAFHLDCIDAWLLSNSTCPLCRQSLLPDGLNFASAAHEPLLDSSRTSADGLFEAQTARGSNATDAIDSLYVTQESSTVLDVEGPSCIDILGSQRVATSVNQDKDDIENADRSRGRVMTVQLGRFRIAGDSSSGATGGSSSVSRRSYSVGSYEYVLDPSNLQVVIAPTPCRRRTSTPRSSIPGHRTTLSDFTPEHSSDQPGNSSWVECFCGEDVDVYSPFRMRRYEPFVRPKEADNNLTVSITLHSTSHAPADVRQSVKEASANVREDETLLHYVKEAPRKVMHRDLLFVGQKLPSGEANPARRAFSFRLPISVAPLDEKLKVNATRRSLSETELAAWDEEDHCPQDVRLVGRTQDQKSSVPVNFNKRGVLLLESE